MKYITILYTTILLSISACSITADENSDPSTQSFSSIMEDKNIELLAAKMIVDEEQLTDSTRIIAISHKAKVLLIGQTPNEEQKALAEQLVSSIDGVKLIYNEIRLGSPITIGSQTSDSWLTATIKTKFYNSQDLPLGKIKVVTENDEVFLIGSVNSAQADTAVEIARNVNGVRKVVRVFELTK